MVGQNGMADNQTDAVQNRFIDIHNDLESSF